MITVTLKNERTGILMPVWLDEGGEVTLSTSDGAVCIKFYTEPEGDEVEMTFHPSMLKMLMAWTEAHPPYTFMAKEGKQEMIAEMQAFDKEWAMKQAEAGRLAAAKPDGVDYPF